MLRRFPNTPAAEPMVCPVCARDSVIEAGRCSSCGATVFGRYRDVTGLHAHVDVTGPQTDLDVTGVHADFDITGLHAPLNEALAETGSPDSSRDTDGGSARGDIRDWIARAR